MSAEKNAKFLKDAISLSKRSSSVADPDPGSNAILTTGSGTSDEKNMLG